MHFLRCHWIYIYTPIWQTKWITNICFHIGIMQKMYVEFHNLYSQILLGLSIPCTWDMAGKTLTGRQRETFIDKKSILNWISRKRKEIEWSIWAESTWLSSRSCGGSCKHNMNISCSTNSRTFLDQPIDYQLLSKNFYFMGLGFEVWHVRCLV